MGEALVQSQLGFNRVPEKVPEKAPGGFGAEPGQEKVPALGLPACFRKIFRNKTLRLLGIPRKLIWI